MRRILYCVVIIAVLTAATACNRASRPEEEAAISAQATVWVVQATVDSMTAASRQTAEAWMADVPIETAQTEAPDATMTASIQGDLSYPAAELPPLRVVAINVETNEFYSVEVKNNIYTIESLPAGSYQVLAYVMKAPGFQEGQAGGYTQAVLCGLSSGCNDHGLVIIDLEEGERVDGINLGDWGAPAGSFPPDPTRQK